MRRYGNRSERHLPPSPEKGLGSKLNWDWAFQILHTSSEQQVRELLQKVGLKLNNASPTQPNFRVPTESESRRFLASPEGKLAVRARIDQLTTDAAHNFLRSADGLAQLAKLKAAVFDESAFQDGDFRNHVFFDAVQSRAMTYLQSPRGQERFRQLVSDAIRDKIKTLDVPARESWISRKVEEILNDVSS